MRTRSDLIKRHRGVQVRLPLRPADPGREWRANLRAGSLLTLLCLPHPPRPTGSLAARLRALRGR